MGDEEGGSSMLGNFGSAFGKGAAKMGRKAAQSEAGRNATKAAVKGACDGARDDLVRRYSSTTTPTSPTPPTSIPSPTKDEPPTAPPDSDDDDMDPYSGRAPSYSYSQSESRPPQTKRTAPPPKPSLLDRFRRKKSDARKPAPRRKVDPKDHIYKQRLAKAPNWDKAQLAQALYNFKGEMKCDLQFRKGQVMQIMTRTDTQHDWWEGKLEDRVGIFPANFVKLL